MDASEEDMKVNVKVCQQTLYITLSGELDQSVAEDVREKIDVYLAKNDYSMVVFNMQNLSFMDSTGIGLILGRYRKLKQRNVGVYIDKPNAQIDKVLRVSGLYTIIPKI